MKNNKISSTLALTLSLATFVAGCSNQEPTPPSGTQTTVAPPAETVQKPAENTAAELKALTDTAVAEVTKAAEPIPQAEPQITSPAPPAPPAPVTPPAEQSSVVTILQRAGTLANEKKYPEALSTLSQLSNVTLTPRAASTL